MALLFNIIAVLFSLSAIASNSWGNEAQDLVPTDLYMSLVDLENQEYNPLIAIKDTPLLRWNGYSNNTVTENGGILKKGTVFPYREGRVGPIKTYEVTPGGTGQKSGLIPVESAKNLVMSREQLLDTLYPQVNKKAKSIAATPFRHFPTFQDKASARGGFSKKQIEVETLRRTPDSEWFFVRYWSDSYNVWIRGWVPSRSLDIHIVPDAVTRKDDTVVVTQAETERIKNVYGLPIYSDVSMHDYNRNSIIAITQVETQTYTYQHYSGRKAEETPYTLKKGSLFVCAKARDVKSPIPLYVANLWFNGVRRNLYVPEKDVMIVSAIDKEKLIDVLYPRLTRFANTTGAASLKELPEMSAADIDKSIMKNERMKVEVIRRTTDYKWYYISYKTDNYSEKIEGWVPADEVELEAEGSPVPLESNVQENGGQEFEVISEGVGN